MSKPKGQILIPVSSLVLGEPLTNNADNRIITPITKLSAKDEYIFVQSTPVVQYIHGKVHLMYQYKNKPESKFILTQLFEKTDNLHDMIELINLPERPAEFLVFVYKCPECGETHKYYTSFSKIHSGGVQAIADSTKSYSELPCHWCGYDKTPLTLVHLLTYQENINTMVEIL